MTENNYNPDLPLLRIVISGSVDDGKSTLIGRLFFDLGQIYEDQLELIKNITRREGKAGIDFSLLTDGLAAEREQKITIDVAYRYFTTAKRRYIIADVPGHEQYTRNMATGAANSEVALILIDASNGIQIQSKRHLFIASLFGIKHILVVINKMDLVGYQPEIFENIKNEFNDFAAKLGIPDLSFIPASSLNGDMIVNRGDNLSWYQGSTVLSYLENIDVLSHRDLINLRLPVQLVLRSEQNDRFYAGMIFGGMIKSGESVMILPSQKVATIKSILVSAEPAEFAFCPQSVAVSFTDHLDISRGDMIVRENNLPEISKDIEAMICWLDVKPFKVGNSYLIKHNAKTIRIQVQSIIYHLNIDTLHRQPANSLDLNDIGKVYLKSTENLIFDPFIKNQSTGGFIIINEESNDTVGVGIIVDRNKNINASIREKSSHFLLSIFNKYLSKTRGHSHHISSKGAVLWFTGLSGSGKTTIADALNLKLRELGIKTECLDGDVMRQSLCSDLGFSPADRDKNIDRASFVAGLLSRHGVVVLATFISPYYRHRQLAQSRTENFIEIFINAPLAECEKRDIKGLYKQARKGELEFFTGITDDYEEPTNPDIEIKTDQESVEQGVEKIICHLKSINIS
ncbi:MAG TPA: adenylyl-sulfate kinase [Patescibacteria group bacterium]|nr:adenylyl-sulfate kinase [Patescibacteria group bacterium]